MEVKKGAEKGEKGSVTLIGGRGEVLHNGRRLRKQEQVSTYDRSQSSFTLVLRVLLTTLKYTSSPKAQPTTLSCHVAQLEQLNPMSGIRTTSATPGIPIGLNRNVLLWSFLSSRVDHPVPA